MAPIKVARSALSLTALDGKLWAMGGYDGSNFSTVVEVYDPLRNFWTDGVPLTSGRSGHAAAVIYQPSNITGTDMCEPCPERGGTSGNRPFDPTGGDGENYCGPNRNRAASAMFSGTGMFGGAGNCSSSGDQECCRENGENCEISVNQSTDPCKAENQPQNLTPSLHQRTPPESSIRRRVNEFRNCIINRRLKQPSNPNLSRSTSRQNVVVTTRSITDDNFELPYNIDIDLLDFTNRIYYCQRCANNNNNNTNNSDQSREIIRGKHTCPGAILKRAVIRFLTNFTSSYDHKRGNCNRPCKRL